MGVALYNFLENNKYKDMVNVSNIKNVNKMLCNDTA